MIELKVRKTNGKWHKCQVPENWAEVKMKHMVLIDFEFKGTLSNYMEMLAVFTDLPVHEVENTPSNLWTPFIF